MAQRGMAQSTARDGTTNEGWRGMAQQMNDSERWQRAQRGMAQSTANEGWHSEGDEGDGTASL